MQYRATVNNRPTTLTHGEPKAAFRTQFHAMRFGNGISCHCVAFLKKFKSCPVLLAFGESGTGKTTALWCALALIGAQNNYFFSKLSKEKVLQLCCTLNIPIGIDDPQSKGDINRLIIDLFNGARNATFAHGSNKPTTTCIIAANFTSSDQQRYS